MKRIIKYIPFILAFFLVAACEKELDEIDEEYRSNSGSTTYYDVDIDIEGDGSVTGSGTYAYGSIVTLTATPDDGWNFVEWSGDASGTSASISITVYNDMNITATFSEDSQSLIYSDYFTSNQGWEEYTDYSDTNLIMTWISSNYYYLYSEESQYFYTSSSSYNSLGGYDNTEDFTVETDIIPFLDGGDYNAGHVGLCLGDSQDELIIFRINTDNYYSIGYFTSDDGWTEWQEDTYSSAIDSYGHNVLKIIRTGSYLYFYINDTWVFTKYSVYSVPYGFTFYFYYGYFGANYIKIYQ